MDDFLGSDDVASIKDLVGLTSEYYAQFGYAGDPLKHFIQIGRYNGVSVREFNERHFLRLYPKFEDEVREQLKNPSSVKSATDLIAIFFRERIHFRSFDATDGKLEAAFWVQTDLPYDVNTIITYAFEQKIKLLGTLGTSQKEKILQHHVQHCTDGLLGSDLALILANFAMAANRPITAEYFLLQYDYGTAWCYPVKLNADRAVYPLLDATTYIEKFGGQLGAKGAFKFASTEDTIAIGGTSLLLTRNNRLVNQTLGAECTTLEQCHAIRLVSANGAFAAVQFPLPTATLNDTTYISIVEELSATASFFAYKTLPTVETCQQVMQNIGYLLHKDTPRLVEQSFEDKPPRSVKYITSKASVRIEKMVLLGLEPDKGEAVLQSASRAILKRLQGTEKKSKDNWQRSFIATKTANLSNLLNGTDTENHIEAAGFVKEELTDLSLSQTNELFRDSKFIVLTPGPEVMNIVFCAPETKVLLVNSEPPEYAEQYKSLASLLGVSLTVLQCSQIEKDEDIINWVQPNDLRAALEQMFGSVPTVKSRIDEQALVYTRQLMNESSKADPDIALRSAINMAGRLVYWSRQVNYMMIDQRFNDACRHVFERALRDYAPEPAKRKKTGSKSRLKVCILASQLYDTGGHTRLIEDIVASQSPFFDIDIVLTNLKDGQGPLKREKVVWPNQRVHTASTGSMVEKARSVHDLVAKLDPDVILNMAHPYDVIAYGFMMREKARRWLFVVHSDHTFSLLPNPKSADLIVVTEPCGSNFTAQGIPHIKLNLASDRETLVHYEPYSSPVSDGLLTMSVGPQHKFYTRGSMRYADVLIARFTATDGKHVHVGYLPDDYMDEMRSVLEPLGFMNRFLCVGFVPSVHQIIHDLQVDLLIGSYPVGGGKAPVEAMAAGCPICQCDDGRWGNGEPMIYPEAFRWKDTQELESIIASIDTEKLLDQRVFSRTYYDNNHSMKLFAETLREAIGPT